VYIVVNKTPSDRFFLKAQGGATNIVNPSPGTCISRGITEENDDKEFFLCAQKVNEGCLNATKYHIIHNDSEVLTTSMIHEMTYNLCYGYYNWSGAIRVPAPLQYAWKLASLASATKTTDPGKQLRDKLFFL